MNSYLFAAYLVVWTVLFFFLVYLSRQQSRIGRDLETFSDRGQEQEVSSEPKAAAANSAANDLPDRQYEPISGT